MSQNQPVSRFLYPPKLQKKQGKEGGGWRRACASVRAGAASLLPDHLALLSHLRKSAQTALQEQRKNMIGHSSCPSDRFLFSLISLAAGEKIGRLSSAYSFETQRHRGSRYWRRPGTATAHFRRGPPRFLPSPAIALSLPTPHLPPWLPLCGIGRS